MKQNLLDQYIEVRGRTLALTENLEPDDFCIQVHEEASPIKWHLAHTTWFFDAFILKQAIQKSFHPFFNSYYESLGEHWPQAKRGFLSRPTLSEILRYRHRVDQAMLLEFADDEPKKLKLIELGLNHEEQHQELILMDLKRNFYAQKQNIIYDQFYPELEEINENKFLEFPEGIYLFGNQAEKFHYDNEGPSHKQFLRSFKIKTSLETNRDFLEFMNDGGYERPEFWLSDGWNWKKMNAISSPLYWDKVENTWMHFTLRGNQDLREDLPVEHISFYEADAYARWKKMRLPTEFEWELASQHEELQNEKLKLWQWTSSEYAPYPGHCWEKGALGEYNSKFMINQKVLRGGSLATPQSHYRNTYRNYFQPDKRWAFTGLRLAI